MTPSVVMETHVPWTVATSLRVKFWGTVNRFPRIVTTTTSAPKINAIRTTANALIHRRHAMMETFAQPMNANHGLPVAASMNPKPVMMATTAPMIRATTKPVVAKVSPLHATTVTPAQSIHAAPYKAAKAHP